MKVRFSAVKISINSDNGIFGQQVRFEDGLNIIRAENTSGKSTLINSIIYALGFERLLSNRKGHTSLKPVLKKSGNYEGEEFKVLESAVYLELQNLSGESISIKRTIIGSDDTDLITVFHGKLITGSEALSERQHFYVNREGSAQREAGFHHYFASFLGLELPYVTRFSGGDVPLYLECLLPLMFIEQIRGWTGVQASIPKNYGIQNVNKISIEYLLNLDAQKIKKQHEDLETEYSEIKAQWCAKRQLLVGYSRNIGGLIKNFPDKPTILNDTLELPILVIKDNEQEISTPLYLQKLRENLSEITNKATINKSQKNYDEIAKQIHNYEHQLLLCNTKLREVNSNLSLEKSTIDSLNEQMESLNRELKRYGDLKRIIEMGADSLELANNLCPTCKQNVNGALVDGIGNPMTIDDNIAFLSSQKQASELLVTSNARNIEALESEQERIEKDIRKIKKSLISIQRDSVSASSISEHDVRLKIEIEEQIRDVESAKDSIDKGVVDLQELSKRYGNYLTQKSKLPSTYFSENDEKKLQQFRSTLTDLLTKFGFRSTRSGTIEISKDHYQPVCSEEGFEIAFDSSASDNVRIVWAYTVALMHVATQFDTNHWGIALLDEPEQQRMKDASSAQLYSSLAQLKNYGFQSIVATSEGKAALKEKLTGVDCNILEFEDKVIKPIDYWLFKARNSSESK